VRNSIESFSASEWKEAISTLRAHSLTPLIWHRLESESDLLRRMPGELQKSLWLDFVANLKATRLREEEVAILIPAFAAAGIHPMVFKGAALAYTAYPNPACRTMCDVDIWVSREQFANAEQVLAQQGYLLSEDARRPSDLKELHNCGLTFYKKSRTLMYVDLHWSVFPGQWFNIVTDIDISSIQTRKLPYEFGDYSVATLSPEDTVIQLAAHWAVNNQMSLGLQPFVDLVQLSLSQRINWSALAERAIEWRVATLTWIFLSLADRLWGMPFESSALKVMRPHRLKRWILSLQANPESVLSLQSNRSGISYFVALLLLPDRSSDAFRLFINGVWPSNEWLCSRYGTHGFRKRVRYLIDIARGSA
jgi:hypothetical protein